MMPRSTLTLARRRAFTIIELLIVVLVIAILMTLVLAVGPRLFSGQKETQAKGLLLTLDRALDAYYITKNAFPKYKPTDYVRVPGPDIFQAGDNLNDEPNEEAFREYPLNSGVRHPVRPDASVFLKQARGVGEVDDILQALPGQFTKQTVTEGSPDPTPTIVDPWSTDIPWASPYVTAGHTFILYVHPGNALAQELYGKCQNGRPYFMSAGPDRKYGLKMESDPDTGGEDIAHFQARIEGTIKDNLYSYPVGPYSTWTPFFNQFR